MAAREKAQRLYSYMVELATLIEDAKNRTEADTIFQAIVIETDTVIATFIWDYFVNWEEVKWSEDKDRTG